MLASVKRIEASERRKSLGVDVDGEIEVDEGEE
jgi:hypothetical protein